MKEYQTEQIRNVVLLGHGGTGKTSLTEAALFATGAVFQAHHFIQDDIGEALGFLNLLEEMILMRGSHYEFRSREFGHLDQMTA